MSQKDKKLTLFPIFKIKTLCAQFAKKYTNTLYVKRGENQSELRHQDSLLLGLTKCIDFCCGKMTQLHYEMQ